MAITRSSTVRDRCLLPESPCRAFSRLSRNRGSRSCLDPFDVEWHGFSLAVSRWSNKSRLPENSDFILDPRNLNFLAGPALRHLQFGQSSIRSHLFSAISSDSITANLGIDCSRPDIVVCATEVCQEICRNCGARGSRVVITGVRRFVMGYENGWRMGRENGGSNRDSVNTARRNCEEARRNEYLFLLALGLAGVASRSGIVFQSIDR